MRKEVMIHLEPKTVEKLKQIKKDTGIPVSQILERSFLKSEYNDPKNWKDNLARSLE